MDRRNFLLTLAAAGAALYVPKRSYFFGGFPDVADVPTLLARQGFKVSQQYMVNEMATGVVASRAMTRSEVDVWTSLGADPIAINREIYVAFLIEDIEQARGATAREYVTAATYSLNHWDAATGYDEYLKAQELNAAEQAWELARRVSTSG